MAPDDRPKHCLKRALWIAGGMVLVSQLSLLLCFHVGCGGVVWQRPLELEPLQLLQASPSGSTDTIREIRFRFDRPIVTPDRVGQAPAETGIQISPQLRGRQRYADRYTLVVSLGDDSGIQPGVRYTAKLFGALIERAGQQSTSFVYRPFHIQKVKGLHATLTAPEPTITVHTNFAVTPRVIERGCFIAARGGGEVQPRIELKADSHQPSQVIRLTPVAPLSREQDYALRCARFKPNPQAEAARHVFELPFRVRPGFRVVGHDAAERKIDPEDARINIRFSTPTTLAQVQRLIKIEPAPKHRYQYLFDDKRELKLSMTLDPSRKYKLTIAGEIQDVYGAPIDRATTITFATNAYRPRLRHQRGIYAIEAKRPYYAIWSRNVDSYQLQCMHIPKKRLVSLVTGQMNYDPWYWAGGQIDWEKLKMTPHSRTIRPGSKLNQWQLARVRPAKRCGGRGRRGVYLMEVTRASSRSGSPWRRAVLANVTDLGVLTKVGAASGLVWVTRLSTGLPVPGARVTVYAIDGRRLFRGRTDAKGLARLPGSERLLKRKKAHGLVDRNEWYSRGQRVIVLVEQGTDLAVVDGAWSNGIQLWNFGVPRDRRAQSTRYRAMLRSDRGIYRPGHTVHFKGLIREIKPGRAPRVPYGKPVHVEVRDSRGQRLIKRALTLSPYGGFAFDLKLSKDARLGDYYVSATVEKKTFRERFLVEAYRPNTFEITTNHHAKHVGFGKKITVAFLARYFFGAAVDAGAVEWSVSRRPKLIRFPRYPGYVFGDYARSRYAYGRYYRGDYSRELSHGTKTIGGDGRFAVVINDVARKDHNGPGTYIVSATVRDQTGQAVTKRHAFAAHLSQFYLGLHTQEYVQAVGMPFAVNAVALTPSGTAAQTSAQLSLVRNLWVCGKKRYPWSPRSCRAKRNIVWKRAIKLRATGPTTKRILVKHPGRYELRIEAKDARGVAVSAANTLYVLGRGQAFWSGDESARMTLVSSKPRFRPGDEAKIVPQSTMRRATSLVTFERNGILEARVYTRRSTSRGFKLKLPAAYAPNVFVSVAMVEPRRGKTPPRFQMGMLDLPVSPDHKRLKVTLDLDRQNYEPGETVRGTVSVRKSGQPVRAEISLAAVDEGVLALTGFKVPDPIAIFFANWGAGVANATNWNRLAKQYDPNAVDPDQGGDGGDGSAPPRSRFVASAYWAPMLVTDRRGQATFSFKAPDNLTAFRVMALAADRGSGFGRAKARFTVQKPLLLKPALPRFLSSGDVANLTAVVHNRTGKMVAVRVRARATGLKLQTHEQLLRIPRGAARKVSFAAHVPFSARTTITLSAEAGSFRDSLRVTLPIRRGIVRKRVTVYQGVVGRTDQRIEVPVQWGATVLRGDSRLHVMVDPSGFGQLGSGLDYLIRYPYGCLEQTLSGWIPLTKLRELAGHMSVRFRRSSDLENFIKAGLVKIARHQHADGNFGYWPGTTAYPHLTAYALFGLQEAAVAGIKTDPVVVRKAVLALKRWSKNVGSSGTPGNLGTAAMAAFVLARAGETDHALVARLYQQRNRLPSWGSAFLLRAISHKNSRDLRIPTLTAKLLATVSQSEIHGHLKYMSSHTRSLAIAISAMLSTNATSAAIPTLVNQLKHRRGPHGRWNNTQENLYALIALADYSRSLGRQRARFSLAVRSGKLSKALARNVAVRGVKSYTIELKDLPKHETRALLKLHGRGQSHVSIYFEHGEKRVVTQPTGRGFAIERQYLDLKSGRPIHQFQLGQLIRVKLTVKNDRNRHYIALSDALPAGLEPVNAKLKTSQLQKQHQRGPWVHTQLRDDRVDAFADGLNAGTHTFSYVARATATGRYVAHAPLVEAMYAPEFFARAPMTQLVIR